MKRYETGWDTEVPYMAYVYDRKLDLKYAVPSGGNLKPYFASTLYHLHALTRLWLFRATHKSPWS